jgi:hypothetical protein
MIEKCRCENHEHFVIDDWAEARQMGVVQHGLVAHAYGAVPAGEHHAPFVGQVCDGCAETHLRDFMREFQPVPLVRPALLLRELVEDLWPEERAAS